MKRLGTPALSLATLTRRDRWRIALVAVIVLSVAIALALQTMLATRATRDNDLAMRQGWSQRDAVNSATVDSSAVVARYGIRQGGTALSWKVASPAEARTSLLALDAAGVRLAAVKLTRDGNGFVVSAELAP